MILIIFRLKLSQRTADTWGSKLDKCFGCLGDGVYWCKEGCVIDFVMEYWKRPSFPCISGMVMFPSSSSTNFCVSYFTEERKNNENENEKSEPGAS